MLYITTTAVVQYLLAKNMRYLPLIAFAIFVTSFLGCSRPADYSAFEGAVNRVYIEDGSGGLILFTPHGDGPPIKNTYVYKAEEYVFLTIKNGWAEIYVPGHRTKYVVPSQRIVRIDRIIPKEANEILKKQVSDRIQDPELRAEKAK